MNTNSVSFFERPEHEVLDNLKELDKCLKD